MSKHALSLTLAALVLFGLSVSKVYNYLLFHSLVEFLNVIVSLLIFVLAWHSRHLLDNRYLRIIGISSLFAGALGLLHAFAYKGMGVFPGQSADLPTQLWIAFRYLVSLSFLAAPVLMTRSIKDMHVLVVYAAATIALIWAIFSGSFPACYIEGRGLTPFKVVSEYVIAFLFFVSLVMLFRVRQRFDTDVFRMLAAALIASMVSELCFTQYASVQGQANMIGHFFLLGSVAFLYRAVVVTGIGEPSRILFRDLKLSEARARESEEQLLTIVEQAAVGIVYSSPEGRLVRFNQKFCEIAGYSRKELSERSFQDITHPDDLAADLEQVQRIRKNEISSFSMEKRYVRGDGSPVWVNLTVSAVRAGTGEVKYFIAIVEDIDLRKRAESRIEHLASFPRLNPNPVLEVDARGVVTFANEAARSTIKELGSGDTGRFVSDELRARLELLESTQGTEVLYHELRLGNRVFHESVYLSGSLQVARIYAADVTEQKRAEEALRANETLLRSIIDSTPDCVFVKDRESRLLVANPATFSVIGCEAEQALRKTDLEIYPDPAVGQAVMENDRRVMASGRSEVVEERVQTPQGYRTFLTTKTPHRDPEGSVIGIIGIARDISDRVELMQNLTRAVTDAERNRSHLEAIFAAQTDAVLMYDQDMNARKANRAFQETYGFDPVGLNLRQIAMRVSATRLNTEHLAWDDQPTPRALRGEIVRGARYRVTRADGTHGVVETSAGPMREGEIITGCVTVWHDVTERVKAEAELQKAKEELEKRVLARTTQLRSTVDTLQKEIDVRSRVEQELMATKERLQNTLESIQDAFFALDRNWKFTYVNSEAVRMFRRDRDDLIGSSYWDVAPMARGTVFEQEYRKVMQEQRPAAFETVSPLLHRWIAVRAYPLDHGISVYVQDISERKQAEQQVRITNDLLKLFARKFSLKEYLDSVVEQLRAWSGCRNVGIRIADAKGYIPYVASAGFSTEFLRCESRLDLKDDRCACTRVISGLYEPQDQGALSPDGSFYSNNCIRFMEGLSGRERERFRNACMASGFASLSVVPIRYRDNVLGAIHLADERENMVPLENVELVERMALIIGEAVYRFGIEDELRSNYDALRDSEARYRALIEDVRDVIFTITPEGTISSLSPAFESITGFAREEWMGREFTSLVHPDDAPEAVNLFQRLIAGEPLPLFELRCRTRSGEYRHMEFTISSERVDGQVLGTARDITERRLAEEERARLVSAVESAAEAVVITAPSTGVIEYVNPAFEQMTGYTREETLGRTMHFIEAGVLGQDFYAGLRDALARDGVWNGKLTNRKKNGTIYFEECTVSAVRNRSGTIINYVYLKRDVTERMRLQSIAEAVNTMNNIGYVFSGISHELGNPVTSLMVNLDLLKEKLDGPLIDYVDRSLGEVSKIDFLLGSLRSFNLYEVQDVRDIHLQAFMDQFLSLVREDFARKGISVVWSPPPAPVSARADSRALQQVLLNIFTNAADALQGRPDPSIRVSVAGNGSDVIMIRVADNGLGMTAEQQANLFKPFHTSKQRGTGLGMVIVKNMLSRMDGSIDVTSREGEGTTVMITIPGEIHGDR